MGFNICFVDGSDQKSVFPHSPPPLCGAPSRREPLKILQFTEKVLRVKVLNSTVSSGSFSLKLQQKSRQVPSVGIFLRALPPYFVFCPFCEACEWHISFMAQAEQPQPQEVFPCFLSRRILMMMSVQMATNTSEMMMVARFCEIQSNMKNPPLY